MRRQTEPVVQRKIRAGAARLVPASLWEESREVRESRHLPNDFMKNNESASALVWNQHPIQGNHLTKVKARIWLEWAELEL
jgi:hypothetical protein